MSRLIATIFVAALATPLAMAAAHAADLDYGYPPPRIVDRPVVYERPVVVERPIVVERPVVVEERAVPYPRPYYARVSRPWLYGRPFYARHPFPPRFAYGPRGYGDRY